MRNLSKINEGADVVTKDYVDSSIPTKTSDLTNDSGFITADEKIKLTSVTNDSEYPVLLGPTSITSGSTYSGDYNTDITINPNSKQLTLKSIKLYYNDNCSATLATKGYVGNNKNHIPIVNFASTAANTSGTLDYYTYLSGVETPTSNASNYDTFVANKKYVDDKFGSIVVPTKTSDLTNDSGFVTTDEKVKATAYTEDGTQKYLIFGENSGSAETKYYDAGLQYAANNTITTPKASLILGNTSLLGQVLFYKGNGNSVYTILRSSSSGADNTVTLPNATGTLALTSDIPTVPTKTSDLTNDSGFVTTDENVKSTTVTTATTYYLVGSTSSSTTTGELSKHASAYIDVSANSNTGGLSTLTLGNNIADGTAGSKEGNIVLYGLGTSKASIYPNNAMSSNSVFFLPKTGGTIALTSDVTDEKVYVTGFIDSGATYYPILATGSGTATRQIDYYGALRYTSTAGSSSTKGTAILELGNSTASGTANNAYGVLRLYGTTTKYYDLKTYPDYPAANRTIYFPRYTSDMYLTCTSSTSAVGGATTKPVYVDDTGCIKAVTSIPYSLLTDVPTVSSNTTGVSISNHSTGSVTGVQSSTTTASKVTLGTAISVPNVTAVGSGSFTQGSFSGGSLTFAIDSTDNKQLNITFTAATHGADSHTHTAPTLGTAKSIPNVTGVSDVTVPIKNTSATTVVTSATHTVTDNGHTHSLS